MVQFSTRTPIIIHVGATNVDPSTLRRVPKSATEIFQKERVSWYKYTPENFLGENNSMSFVIMSDGQIWSEVTEEDYVIFRGSHSVVYMFQNLTLKRDGNLNPNLPVWIVIDIFIGYDFSLKLVEDLRIPEIGQDVGDSESEPEEDIESTQDEEENEEVLSNEDEPSGENQNDGTTICLICYDRSVDSVLYSCGHMVMCFECATILMDDSGTCPICREEIRDVVKCYT